MNAVLISEAPAVNEAYLRRAESLLGSLNEAFREMATTSFYEEYEGLKEKARCLKVQIYALGFGVERDVTGWRLAQ